MFFVFACWFVFLGLSVFSLSGQSWRFSGVLSGSQRFFLVLLIFLCWFDVLLVVCFFGGQHRGFTGASSEYFMLVVCVLLLAV